MKESFDRIIAWCKAHPWAAAGILGVIILLGIWIAKSGKSSGITLDTSQAQETGLGGVSPVGSTPLPDLGSSMPSNPMGGESPLPSLPTIPSLGGIGEMMPLDLGTGFDSSWGAMAGGSLAPTSAPASIIGHSTGGLNVPGTATASAVKASGIKVPGAKTGTTGARTPTAPKRATGLKVPGVKTGTTGARTPTAPKRAGTTTKTPAEQLGYSRYYTGMIKGVVYVAGYPTKR